MRVSDLSSDVCSSDLRGAGCRREARRGNSGRRSRGRREARRGLISIPLPRAGEGRGGRVAMPSQQSTTPSPTPPVGGSGDRSVTLAAVIGAHGVTGEVRLKQNGRAHVVTPVTNAHLVCCSLL